MKYRIELLGEAILMNHVIHVGKVVPESGKWFFNVLLISGVGVSLFSDNKEDAIKARKKLIKTKIKNDKEFLKLSKHNRR